MKELTKNIIDQLKKMPQSKEQRSIILDLIDDGSLSMNQLIELYFDEDIFVCQKTGWILQILAKDRTYLIRPYEKILIEGLESAPHDAYIRNTVRIFQDMDVSQALEGILYDLCFHYLTSFKTATAIKAFSLTVLRKIAIKHIDLIEELISAIEEQMEHGTTGFNNRAGKELLILHKKKG